MDRSAPGTIIRRAFALEAFFNFSGGILMIGFPTRTLALMQHSSSSPPAPLAITMTQWLGAVVLGLTAPLLLGLPNTRRAVESRVTTYWTLGVPEVCLVGVMLWQLGKGQEGSLSRTSLWVWVVQLSAICGWRAFVLIRKPEWMGRYRELEKKQE
jgi:hypothetical protein